jgi:hypothetical protein
LCVGSILKGAESLTTLEASKKSHASRNPVIRGCSMSESSVAIEKLEAIQKLWVELGRVRLKSQEYETLLEKIRVLSAEYQLLIESK